MAEAPAAPRIFVSYARSDGKAVAAELRRRLQDEHGFPLWQDLADLEGGGNGGSRSPRRSTTSNFWSWS